MRTTVDDQFFTSAFAMSQVPTSFGSSNQLSKCGRVTVCKPSRCPAPWCRLFKSHESVNLHLGWGQSLTCLRPTINSKFITFWYLLWVKSHDLRIILPIIWSEWEQYPLAPDQLFTNNHSLFICVPGWHPILLQYANFSWPRSHIVYFWCCCSNATAV